MKNREPLGFIHMVTSSKTNSLLKSLAHVDTTTALFLIFLFSTFAHLCVCVCVVLCRLITVVLDSDFRFTEKLPEIIQMEKEMATPVFILAWEIPWTEEPGGPQSRGLQSWTRLSN